MQKFLKPIGFLLISGLFFVSAASAQTIHSIDADQKDFFENIANISGRLLRINPKRLSRLRAVNQSYENVQKAITLLSTGGTPQEIKPFLEKAISQFSDNSFAALYLGALLEDENKLEEAAVYYRIFYQKSHFPTEIDQKIIKSKEAHFLRAYLENWFYEKGLEPPKIKVPLSFKFRRGLQRLHVFPTESLLGILLTLIAFGGFAFLLFYHAIYRDEIHLFKHPVAKFFLRLYYATTFAYFSWITHLYLGIQPILKTHLRQTFWIIGIGSFAALLIPLLAAIREKKEIQKDPNLKLCPFCGKPVIKIVQECPSCRKRI